MSKNREEAPPIAPETHPGSSLTIDWELYGSYLEESDLSEQQKREFIQTLWSIVVSFVDLGFGTHPLQQANPDGCEQLPDLAEILASDLGHVVSSKHQFSKTEFIKAAARELHERSKGIES